MHDRPPKGLPINATQVPQLRDDLKAVQSVPIRAAVNRLNLEKRIFFIELDGDIRPSQADVCKKRPKPPVGLNDSLIVFIPLAAC